MVKRRRKVRTLKCELLLRALAMPRPDPEYDRVGVDVAYSGVTEYAKGGPFLIINCKKTALRAGSWQNSHPQDDHRRREEKC